jgi:hypothetical protein
MCICIYNQDDQVKKDEMGRTCSTYWEERNTHYKIFVGKLEGRRPLGRPRRRRVDNIVTCMVAPVTKITGSSSDDWIY